MPADALTLVLTSVLGAGATVGGAMKLFERLSLTKRTMASNALGTTLERHMYQQYSANEKKIEQLQAQVLELSVKLAKAEATIAQYKALFEKMASGYERLQAENSLMRGKLGMTETGKEGRPYLPGGAP